MTKFFNVILILVILVAGGRLVMQGQASRALLQERKQLMETLDGFQVRDQSKYLVQMVDTDDPTLFMWRLYVPAGFQTNLLANVGGKEGGVRSYSERQQGNIERVSVSFECVGDSLCVDVQSFYGGHRSSIGGKGLVEFFQRHWSDLEVEILGEGEPVEIDSNQIVDLMSIKIPDELYGELKTKFGKKLSARFSNEWFCRVSFSDATLIERSRQQSQGVRP